MTLSDDYIDIEANEYLAALAQSSPKWAENVLTAERNRANDLRMWHLEVLETLVWGWHGQQCRCPVEDFSEPCGARRV